MAAELLSLSDRSEHFRSTAGGEIMARYFYLQAFDHCRPRSHRACTNPLSERDRVTIDVGDEHSIEPGPLTQPLRRCSAVLQIQGASLASRAASASG